MISAGPGAKRIERAVFRRQRFRHLALPRKGHMFLDVPRLAMDGQRDARPHHVIHLGQAHRGPGDRRHARLRRGR